MRRLILAIICLAGCPLLALAATTHVVQKGDTLWAIAKKHGVAMGEIASANGIGVHTPLKVGQKLAVPDPSPRPSEPEAKPSDQEPVPPPGEVSGEAPVQESVAAPDAAAAPSGDGAAAAEPPADGGVSGVDKKSVAAVEPVRPPVEAVPKAAVVPPQSSVGKPAYHTVKKGDSLSAIGRAYGVAVGDLIAWNGLKSNGAIYAGQKIRLSPPAASQTVQKPPEPQKPAPAPPPKSSGPNPLPKQAVRTAPRTTDDTGFVGPPAPSREPARDWLFLGRAKAQIDQPKVKKGRWLYIVLHHSGTKIGNARIFDAAHRERGMENGLAYHFVIGNGSRSGDGEIEVGSRWTRQIHGGHLAIEKLNLISIGVCFVGNFNETKVTSRQVAACMELSRYLRSICGANVKVVTHTEIHPKHTECPGRKFPIDLIRRSL